jgi:FMN phosphatase YigB (HAD superfamily)
VAIPRKVRWRDRLRARARGKPDPRIYRIFCERYALAPESCVFIDDSPVNVESARRFGMQAFHFTGDTKALRKALIDLGLPLKAA